jgi:hypothetical protein
LAHPVGIELIMRAIPRLFVAAVLVIAVAAHPFCIVFLIWMSAIVGFLSKSVTIIHFLLGTFELAQCLCFIIFRKFVNMLQVLQLFREELDVEMHVLVYQLLLLGEKLNTRLLITCFLLLCLSHLVVLHWHAGGRFFDDLLRIQRFRCGDLQWGT